MIPNLSMNGVDFNEISRLLYTGPLLEESDVRDTWAEATALLRKPKQYKPGTLKGILCRCMPHINFQPTMHGEVFSMFVQFLVAASFQMGRLHISKRCVSLRFNGYRLELDRDAYEWKGGRRRFPEPIDMNPELIVKAPIGRPLAVGSSLGAIYGFFCRHFPDLHAHMEYLAALSHRTGNESVLVDAFDLDHILYGTDKGETFSNAIKYVEQAERQPYAVVLMKMMSKLPKEVVKQHLIRTTAWNESARESYIVAIRYLQKIYNEMNSNADVPDPQALKELMELQQLIRGT